MIDLPIDLLIYLLTVSTRLQEQLLEELKRTLAGAREEDLRKARDAFTAARGCHDQPGFQPRMGS